MSIDVPPDRFGRCLVTGVSGFVGSHLAEKLLELGAVVVGVDSFSDYYDRRSKEMNLSRHTHADCSAAERDLGFRPRTSLEEGLRAQVAWLEGR